MPKLTNEMQPYTEDLFDFLGKKIEAGKTIVYASLLGRSAKLTLGQVIGIYIPRTGYDKFTIKVQPLKDSAGGNFRFKEFQYDHVLGKGEYVNKDARPVFLKFSNRLMVLD